MTETAETGVGNGRGGGPGGDSNRSSTVVAYPSVFDDGSEAKMATETPTTR